VLGERLAGAGEVAAPVQPRVEHVQYRAADLAQLHRSEGGQDGPPDVAVVGLPGRAVELGHLHVLPQQLGDRHAGVRLSPFGDLLQQFAQEDLRLFFGLDGLAEP
jgi:hypothetical protein